MKAPIASITALSTCALIIITASCRPRQAAPPSGHVTTAAEQASLTPDEVLQQLKDGNNRFHSGNVTLRDHTEQIRQAVPGQYPKAMVLSCLDSRVPVEDVFDQGMGDVFVGKVGQREVGAPP